MYSIKLYSDESATDEAVKRENQSRAAFDFLTISREFRNSDIFCTNLFFTTADQLAKKTNTMPYDKVFFWTISEVDDTSPTTTTKVAGIAMATMPFSLIVSPMPEAALSQLLCGPSEESVFVSVYVKGFGFQKWGAVIPCGLESTFLKIYQSQHPNISITEEVQENIYKLEDSKLLIPTRQNGTPIPGRMRRLYSNEKDISLGISFYKGFIKELGISQRDLEDRVKNGAKDGTMFVWEVLEEEGADRPAPLPGVLAAVEQQQSRDTVCDMSTVAATATAVSFAGHIAPVGDSPGGLVARIAPVFTPREERGRGYAAALTAALASHLISNLGARTMLYAVKDNPISNRVYTKIGFEIAGQNTKFILQG